MNAPARIAVLQPAFLGDVVFASPLTRALRAGFPAAQLAMLVRPPADDIARHLPGVDVVLTYDKRGSERGLAGFRKAARALADFAPDLVLSLHDSLRTGALALASGAPERLGPAESLAAPCYTWTCSLEGLPFVERSRALATALGLPSQADLALVLPAGVRAWGRAAIPARTVALIPGSEWPTKRWPVARGAALARLLLAQARAVVLLGSPAERALCAELNAGTGGRCLDVSGNRVEESLAILAASAAVVGGDSGLSHAARALGRPTVTLFGPTASEAHVPATRDAFVSLRLPCAPCSDHGSRRCPLGHHRCLGDLSEVLALAALERVR